MSDNKPKYPVQTVSKAIEIINYLAKDTSNRGAGITELSREIGMAKVPSIVSWIRCCITDILIKTGRPTGTVLDGNCILWGSVFPGRIRFLIWIRLT